MKKFLQTYKYLILILALGILLVILFKTFGKSTPTMQKEDTKIQNVSVLPLGKTYQEGKEMTALGNIVAAKETALVPESTGKVNAVYVQEGDRVSKGDKIIALNTSDQSVAYRQAQAQLDNQKIILAKLEREYNRDASTSQEAIVNQQSQMVEQAYQNFLNNDLRAYPKDNPERQRGGAPIISGTYQSNQEGTYEVEVYASGTATGASFRYSGLETGTAAASVNFSEALGSRGLELKFPENFSKHETWVIPIPNTRSSSYIQAKNAYESAKAGSKVTLETSKVTKDDVEKQQNVVRQQKLAVDRAAAALAKGIVRAPFSGTITQFDISAGAVVNAFSPIGTIKSLDALEVDFSVSNKERMFINKGDSVFHDDTAIGEVTYVANSLDPQSYTNQVRAKLFDASSYTEGDTISLRLRPDINDTAKEADGENTSDIIVPLTAIQIIGNDPYVMTVNEKNMTVLTPVKIGLLFGSQIEIVGGLEGDELIIRDARNLNEGLKVSYK